MQRNTPRRTHLPHYIRINIAESHIYSNDDIVCAPDNSYIYHFISFAVCGQTQPVICMAYFRKMPTTLEYFSYVFHFQALMAGPVIFYRDYIDFIHGRNLTGARALTVRVLFNHPFFCVYTLSITTATKKRKKGIKIITRSFDIFYSF